jgi:hypothetical protein
LKLLLTSVDCLIDSSTGKYFPGIEAELDKYLAMDKENKVVVISIRKSRLNAIPKKYNPLVIPYALRGTGPELFKFISNALKVATNEVIVLGGKAHDLYTAGHTKSILLSAVYAKGNNPTDTLYKKEYGIPLNNVKSIGAFFENFYGIENPWYLKIDVDQDTTMYALTNANTWGINGTTLGDLKVKFRECLKNDNKTYIIPFTSYFLVSTHMIKDLGDVDIWDIYPSSEKEKVNEDLLYFAKKAAHSFDKEFFSERLLIRKKDTAKRHSIATAQRIANGAKDELESMIVNPVFKGKLSGKSVAIVDDFSRIGTSCETVRLLLQKAGVRRLIFIAMGKFGNDKIYHKYEYELKGSVYSGVNSNFLSKSTITGVTNDKSNHEFLESLRSLV